MLTRDDFALLYESQSERLRTWTRRVLRDSYRRADADGEAEDLCEDVWARTWEHWSDFAEMPTAGYLFSAVKHAMIDAYRRRSIIHWETTERRRGPESDERDSDWLYDPRDRYEQLETRLDLAAALGLLTETERRAFVAFHVLDGGNLNASDQKMARLRARHYLRACPPLEGYDGWQAPPSAHRHPRRRRPGAWALYAHAS